MASNPAYAPLHPVYRVVYKITVLLVVLIPLLATVLAIGLLWQRAVHLPDLILLAVMYALVAFGVTVGYHRMLTHRSFRAHPAVKLLLLILGSMAFEGPALDWAATHTAPSKASSMPTSAGSSATVTRTLRCTPAIW